MSKTPPKVASYRHPHVPTIAFFNRAKTPSGVEFDALIKALQKYVDEHFAPIWGTPAKLVKSTGFLKGKWAIGFFDDADEAGTEGYHDVTPEGLPFAKIFVRTTIKLKDRVSVTASHELAEMLVDPAANLYSTGPKQSHLYDYEVADPVEELWFPVNGIAMVNFVYPEYFEVFHKPGSVRLDHMGKLKRPFEIHKGGYQSYWLNGKEKTVWGCLVKKRKFLTEDRRGHRTELRGKGAKKASAAEWGVELPT